MRILQVLHSAGYGGAETHALRLSLALIASGHEVMLAAPSDSWLARACADTAVPFMSLRMLGVYDLVSIARLRRRIRSWRPDVVHAHLVRASHYARWACSGLREVRTVATAHATNAWRRMHHCDHVIAVSAAVRLYLLARGYPSSQVTVVHNGVPDVALLGDTGSRRATLRREFGLGDSDFAVFNASRFIQDKGQDLMVVAAALCRKPTHLFLAGDPATPFGREVHARAGSSVHFLGYRSDVQQLLPAFDAYLCASRREAFGLSILEASAAGLPVVATAVGGIPEIVEHGITGWLVPAEDPMAMTQALDRIAADRTQAAAMGYAGRQRFLDAFTVEVMAQRTLEVYRSVCAGPRRCA